MDEQRERKYALSAYLVASARLGERDAWERLYRLWHAPFVAHAWRLCGSRDAAQDHVQDAWAEILKGLPGLRSDRAFPAWAHRIVTRKCMRVGRAEPFSVSLPPMETGDEGAAAAQMETRVMLARAMAQLPPDQHAAIALFYREGMRIAEIAIAMDAPVGTIKTRLMAARQKLQDIIEGDT